MLDVKHGWENVLDVKHDGRMCLEQLLFHNVCINLAGCMCMYKFSRA